MGDLGNPSFEAQMPSAGMHEEHSSYDVWFLYMLNTDIFQCWFV